MKNKLSTLYNKIQSGRNVGLDEECWQEIKTVKI